MTVIVRRLLHTERLRLAIVLGATAAWFLLILLVVRNSSGLVSTKTQMAGSALTKGFGLGSLATPDRLLANMVAVSFNHPIVLALVGAVTVTLGARSCQGELAAGTIDVTLSRAISRSRYLAGYLVVIAVAVTAEMSVAWASMVGFDRLLGVPGTIDAGRAAIACANGAVVFLGFGTLAVLVSVLLGRRGSASFLTIGILVAMYADTFTERIWSSRAMDVLGPLSLFHWFDPASTLLGQSPGLASFVVPAAFSIACAAAALWRFERRDL